MFSYFKSAKSLSTTVVAAASFDYAVILIRGGVSDGCFGLVWRVAAVG